MTKKILIPLPSTDFDPTEAAIPWRVLSEGGLEIVFATPNGESAVCDLRMLEGHGLGVLRPLLQADRNGRAAYAEMAKSSEFLNPLKWSEVDISAFSGVILPGGHAPGMRAYLDSAILQSLVARFFSSGKPVGAICHGVLLAARSKAENGQSVLFGKKTTALLASQEMAAWALTCLWLGNYYRTYAVTVEAEVKSCLVAASDFVQGPTPIFRDEPSRLERGFCVRDGNYLSARWPGDAHRFASEFLKMIP